MKIIIVIPMQPYLFLMGRCEIDSLEYHLLKNGLIQRSKLWDEVEILLNSERAKGIMEFVARVAPQFTPAIRQIDLPPDA